MSDTSHDVSAAAIAQTALAIAKQAEEKADQAMRETQAGWRSCQKDLGILADGLRQMAALVDSLQTRLGEWILRSSPPPQPDDSNGDL